MYNGNFIAESKLHITAQNRAFRYGDAVFESMRVVAGRAMYVPLHWERLWGGMGILQFEPPSYFNQNYLSTQINSLILMNRITTDARLRITVYRDGEGTYTPQTNDISCLITLENLPTTGYELNNKGLLLGVYQEYLRPITPFSMFKNGNSLYYVLAGLYAQKNGFDECVLINQNHRVAECISSNIFVIKDKKIYTPPCTDGAIVGVMRRIVMDICTQNGLYIGEKSLAIDDLLAADEVFLTNAVAGVRSVMGIKNKRFFMRQTQNIHKLLNDFALTNGA
jgi:branched-chain amino acid aminotransferase